MDGELINLEPLIEYLDQVNWRGRTMLLPALHKAQNLYGWLPREVLQEISKALRVPAADIHGVVEFYSMFYNQPVAKRVIRVCQDSACQVRGAEKVWGSLKSYTGLTHGQTADSHQLTIEYVPCLGLCEAAPALMDGEHARENVQPEEIPDLLLGRGTQPIPRVYGSARLVTKRIGEIDPESIESYENMGGYTALRKAVEGTPEDLIKQVDACGILGRGGAMFPVGKKSLFTRQAAGTNKQIVINADESEPGTFKDRYLMENDPFSVIEGATLAAYAVGAETGWIFIRGEYPLAYERLQKAVQAARDKGLLGESIAGVPGFNFDIELRLGAGAYICGEETALFEAIEGKRGFPRIKPPFPTTHGLFMQPTVVNNVESLAAVVAALSIGVDEWTSYGTPDSPGTKLFCLSGHIQQPGLYEVPFGLTIRELLDQAGGILGGKLGALLVGGAAGVFVGPEKLDTPLTYEDAKAAGITLGSGVLMAFNDAHDLRQTLFEIGRFFAHESCGKCFPCQLGTQRQLEILKRAAAGKLQPGDRVALDEIGLAMTLTSLCGLGQTAASAVLSAVNRWEELI